MIPLPVSPTVVVLVDSKGNVTGIASNISTDLKVVVTNEPTKFDEAAKGKPFVDSVASYTAEEWYNKCSEGTKQVLDPVKGGCCGGCGCH